MLANRRLHIAFLSIFLTGLLTSAGFCQNAPQLAPVPTDALELVNGATQVPRTPQERASALNLVERARQNSVSTPGAPAYTLKVNFTASGNVLYTGSGEMEETWLSPLNFRWSARLGDFELTRISARAAIFDDRPADFIPIRLHMLRDALFWPVNLGSTNNILIRTAAAHWKGQEVTCILTSGAQSDPTPTPGRRWYEREYCVDHKSGLMQILSDAPGIYVLYDYRNALQFHGRSLPSQISIVEGGKTVLEAHLGSIADADVNDTDLLTPNPLMMRNAGPILSRTMRFPEVIHVAPGASIIQPVIVHALIGSDGKVLDAELVENSGAALSQSALDLVKRSSYVRAKNGRLQREAFINVQFVSQ
jgi:Gram-negative bacterial TonB protein C-terminal